MRTIVLSMISNHFFRTTKGEQSMKKISGVLCLALAAALLLTGGAPSYAADGGKVSQIGKLTVYSFDSKAGDAAINYDRALPMPLPQSTIRPSGVSAPARTVRPSGAPGFQPGARGSVITSGTVTDSAAPVTARASSNEAAPMEYGSENIPYTTSRVDWGTNNAFSKTYPYRAAGKLYFNIGSNTYVCSASLIKTGVIVTAAHCVADFGASTFYTNWKYIPALYGTTKPYGTWSTVAAYVMTSYLNGTDPCAQSGVVCQNDVAVLVVKPTFSGYPGKKTGWFGYGVDGWGFNSLNQALIQQLGYPVSHDSGLKMQRTDSQGYVDNSLAGNTVWGSRQTGGSSGGPEVVNLGYVAALNGISVGSEANTNIVVGVTSWGYTNQVYKVQGASPFTTNNIVQLVNTACGAYPKACQ